MVGIDKYRVFIVSHRKTERVKTSLIIRFAFYEIIFNSVWA